ncbi:hypothetical protein [Zooshikella sp. RANM57]|uniref:hypothetical protein n=1 Tax=Zooshikella sp. RANM57 TaxID=3425863 RepID=UPI003D6DD5CB
MVFRTKPWEQYQPNENCSTLELNDPKKNFDIHPTYFSPPPTLIIRTTSLRDKNVVIPQEEFSELKNMVFYIKRYSTAAFNFLSTI